MTFLSNCTNQISNLLLWRKTQQQLHAHKGQGRFLAETSQLKDCSAVEMQDKQACNAQLDERQGQVATQQPCPLGISNIY